MLVSLCVSAQSVKGIKSVYDLSTTETEDAVFAAKNTTFTNKKWYSFSEHFDRKGVDYTFKSDFSGFTVSFYNYKDCSYEFVVPFKWSRNYNELILYRDFKQSTYRNLKFKDPNLSEGQKARIKANIEQDYSKVSVLDLYKETYRILRLDSKIIYLNGLKLETGGLGIRQVADRQADDVYLCSESALQEIDQYREDLILKENIRTASMESTPLEKAIESIDYVIERQPNVAVNYITKGDVFLRNEKWDEAVIQYEKAESMDPNAVGNIKKKKSDELFYESKKYINWKKYDIGLDLLDGAIRINPRDSLYSYKANALFLRGETLIKQNKIPDAINDFTQLTKLPLSETEKNTYSETLNQYAHHLTEEEHFNEALSVIECVITLRPNDANVYDAKGEILCMMDDKEKAREEWNKAISIDPNYAQKETSLYKILFVPPSIDIEKELGEFESNVGSLVKAMNAGKSYSKSKIEDLYEASDKLSKASYAMNRQQKARYEKANESLQLSEVANDRIKQEKKKRRGEILKGVAGGLLGL